MKKIRNFKWVEFELFHKRKKSGLTHGGNELFVSKNVLFIKPRQTSIIVLTLSTFTVTLLLAVVTNHIIVVKIEIVTTTILVWINKTFR